MSSQTFGELAVEGVVLLAHRNEEAVGGDGGDGEGEAGAKFV